MKWTIVPLILALLFAPAGLAKERTNDVIKSGPTQSAECERLRASGSAPEVLAQRGCCSWHQGVCGCQGGRVVCCDNTYSPSCRC